MDGRDKPGHDEVESQCKRPLVLVVGSPHLARASSSIMAAHFSPIMIDGALPRWTYVNGEGHPPNRREINPEGLSFIAFMPYIANAWGPAREEAAMVALLDQAREPFVATEEEALIAKEAAAKLRPVAEANTDVRVRVVAKRDIVVPLPARIVKLVVDLLSVMAEGKAVSFVPHQAELTTQQAADFLNVSRPHLVGLLEKNQIPYRKVGSHRRILVSDLIEYKKNSDENRRAAIRKMVAEAQKLDLP